MEQTIKDLLGLATGGAPLAAVTAAVYLAVLLARKAAPSTWAKLPAWAQPVAPIALAGVGAGVEAMRSGLRWPEALALGAQAAIAAIGAHHVLKRVTPSASKSAATTAAAGMVFLVAGCGIIGGDPQTARDAYVECVAERVEPELRALLAKAAEECPTDGRCKGLEEAALARLEEIATECGVSLIEQK
jgi:hypothetical protein